MTFLNCRASKNRVKPAQAMLSAADSRITISTATQQIVRYDTPTAQYQHYSNTKK